MQRHPNLAFMALFMLRQRHYGGFITLCLLLTCRLDFASDPTPAPQPAPPNPALSGSTDLSSPSNAPIPAVMALPANLDNTSNTADAGTNKRFYTISATLREIYDDNVNTTHSNVQTSYETSVAPSILVSFPSNDTTLSARYTFNLIYYDNQGQNSGNSNDAGSLQTTHDFVAVYQHSFSDRFILNLADEARYYFEPSLYENTGTPFRNGAYISNAFNGTLSAQWTPLWGTTTTYSNTIVNYEDQLVAQEQNNDENTASQTVSYAFLPKLSLSTGFIYDDVRYNNAYRGYTNYTLFAGGVWQALPSLSLSARGGGSYFQTVNGLDSTSPYAALSLNWQLGQRSSLGLNYSHEVSPTSQFGAQAQTIDRIGASFNYVINPRLSAHLVGAYQLENIPSSLLTSQMSSVSAKESYYYVDTGLTYTCDKYINFNAGLTATANYSDDAYREYTRQQLYIGVQGTY